MASHMHCPSCGGAIKISSDKLSDNGDIKKN